MADSTVSQPWISLELEVAARNFQMQSGTANRAKAHYRLVEQIWPLAVTIALEAVGKLFLAEEVAEQACADIADMLPQLDLDGYSFVEWFKDHVEGLAVEVRVCHALYKHGDLVVLEGKLGTATIDVIPDPRFWRDLSERIASPVHSVLLLVHEYGYSVDETAWMMGLTTTEIFMHLDSAERRVSNLAGYSGGPCRCGFSGRDWKKTL